MRVAALLLTLAMAAAPIVLKVRPDSGIGPQRVRVEVHAIFTDDDRVLIIELDNGTDFYSRSDIPIDGAAARHVQTWSPGRVPAGEYEVRASIYTASGRARAAVLVPVTYLPY